MIEEEGELQDFEDAVRLQSKRPSARMDRRGIFECVRKLGLNPEKTFFARAFDRSRHIWPLPQWPEAEDWLSPRYDGGHRALERIFGVRDDAMDDDEFGSSARWVEDHYSLDARIDAAYREARKAVGRVRRQDKRDAALRPLVDAFEAVEADRRTLNLPTLPKAIYMQIAELFLNYGEHTEAFKAYDVLWKRGSGGHSS